MAPYKLVRDATRSQKERCAGSTLPQVLSGRSRGANVKAGGERSRRSVAGWTMSRSSWLLGAFRHASEPNGSRRPGSSFVGWRWGYFTAGVQTLRCLLLRARCRRASGNVFLVPEHVSVPDMHDADDSSEFAAPPPSVRRAKVVVNVPLRDKRLDLGLLAAAQLSSLFDHDGPGGGVVVNVFTGSLAPVQVRSVSPLPFCPLPDASNVRVSVAALRFSSHSRRGAPLVCAALHTQPSGRRLGAGTCNRPKAPLPRRSAAPPRHGAPAKQRAHSTYTHTPHNAESTWTTRARSCGSWCAAAC